MRTVDQTVTKLSDRLDKEQESVYGSLRETFDKALTTLQANAILPTPQE